MALTDVGAPPSPAYRLGCPIWACPAWKGHLYADAATPKEFLSSYAEVFGCVEGNSTFYALPSVETVDRWRTQTPDGFHFCFKFPKTITHDRMLVGATRETEGFLLLMRRLSGRLGPLLIQLPPAFGPDQLTNLDRFLSSLPDDFRYAVEVRHRDLFGAAEDELQSLLDERGIARGLMDTRAVHAAGPVDATTIVSQGRKPKVPWRSLVSAGTPFVRIVGQNDVRATSGYLDQWADIVAGWLRRGWSPYVFMHSPDDFYAPRLARAFHFLLRKRCPDLSDHPEWPGERAATTSQLDLL